MHSIMEKKVYRIKKWDYKHAPECLEVLPRYDSDDLYEAKFRFVFYANDLLRTGCVITHITNAWSYEFRSKDGKCFALYMYED